jgi:hypothetical protein
VLSASNLKEFLSKFKLYLDVFFSIITSVTNLLYHFLRPPPNNRRPIPFKNNSHDKTPVI